MHKNGTPDKMLTSANPPSGINLLGIVIMIETEDVPHVDGSKSKIRKIWIEHTITKWRGKMTLRDEKDENWNLQMRKEVTFKLNEDRDIMFFKAGRHPNTTPASAPGPSDSIPASSLM